MRNIKYIVLHCTATKEDRDFTAEDVDIWHKKRGFKKIGYHYLVGLKGNIEVGRYESEQGAHVKGFNKNSIGICYVGGLDSEGKAKDTRTIEQKKSLKELLKDLRERYPHAEILGHRDFSKDLNRNGVIEPFEYMKQCPCFDARKEYKYI